MKLRLIYSARFGPWHYFVIAASLSYAFVAIVLLVLTLFPRPHNRVHYLIAGTTPTAMGLLGVSAWVERKRFRLRNSTVRRVPASRRRA